MNLYLVRHGETIWNTERRFQGNLDSPLTELGRQQAQTVGRLIADIPFSAVYCSPAPRAQHTLSLVLAGRPELARARFDPRILEMHLGIWEGMRIDEVLARYPKESQIYFNDFERYVPPGPTGERYTELYARTGSFLTDLQAEYNRSSAAGGQKAATNVLVISHGLAMMALFLHLNGQPLSELRSRPLTRQGIVYRAVLDSERSVWTELDPLEDI